MQGLARASVGGVANFAVGQRLPSCNDKLLAGSLPALENEIAPCLETRLTKPAVTAWAALVTALVEASNDLEEEDDITNVCTRLSGKAHEAIRTHSNASRVNRS
jgi:hypothetical protein